MGPYESSLEIKNRKVYFGEEHWQKATEGLTLRGYPSGIQIRSGIMFPEDTSTKKTVKTKGKFN